MFIRLISTLLIASPLAAQVDTWDLPPLRYSDTESNDRIASLEKKWQKDNRPLTGTTELERVSELLQLLHVPQASQILVFSKTSKQNGLIHPGNPRAMYFSQDCYCAFVPGGLMEVIIHEPILGPVFYVIDLGHAQKPPHAQRDTSDCMSCHGTGRTENVPGMMIRSVFPDENGHPLFSLGSELVTHETPIPQRWGGYYVTGSIALPHLGNQTYTNDRKAEPKPFEWPDLTHKIDTTKYPRPTSDIVALMVLEHQCKAHNLLSAAAMNYQRAYFLGKSLDPAANPDEGSAGRIADLAAKNIVSWFFFRGEADMGEDGVTGDEEFQREFSATIPKAKDGSSLGDFQLNTRLFKNRCSYMVYSEAYRHLPPRVRTAITTEMQRILTADQPIEGYEDMKPSERSRILAILKETSVL